MKVRLLLAAILPVAAAAMGTTAAEPIRYPATKRQDLVEKLHGKDVADPYRWLEDDVRKSDDVKKWVADQNAVTSSYLAAIPARESIRRQLTETWNYERYSAPSKVGQRYVFRKNNGLQNQDVVYIQDTLSAPPRELMDPNKWSRDGTIALSGMNFTDDGKYVAYGVAESGSDWVTWKIMHVDSGKVLPDEIKWVKYSGTSWTKDGRGLFYSRFAEPKPGETFQALTLNQQLYYHRLGTLQSDDLLVYERPDQPKWGVTGGTTEDGRYLIIYLSDGTTSRKAQILIRDLEEPLAMPITLIGNFDHKFNVIDNDGPVFYLWTDADAPLGRVVAVDIRKPQKENWKEIIPQAKETLQGVGSVGNMLVANYLKDAKSQIKLHRFDGSLVREVDLPGIGSAAGFGGKRTDLETFYTFSSYATPSSIFRYDLLTGKSELYRRAGVKFDASKYEVKQVFCASKDGTKIPLFITHRKGITLDGSHPTLLYGYGGFNISMTPGFSVGVAQWLDMGGIYVVANLRGGGEYGREWHRSGTKERKQNVFDDFIASAEYLIREKYTSTPKLAIRGGSNGGLLVGAVMAQRPDLFGACLPHVGVMDMLRFHKFTAGRFWVDDYGSPDNATDFKSLVNYSPYHNLKPGTKYPPTLVITADTDDRVVPGHSFKFAAQLQYAQAGSAPVLARIESRAGHGAGKPTAKIIEELADEYAFLVKNLGMAVK